MTGTGFCACGCGARTKIARQNRESCGDVKGEPRRFLRGHNGSRPGPRAPKRNWTHVTLPMRARMRELRAAGLKPSAIAIVIALDYGLPKPPSRPCIDAHAPRNGSAA